LMSAWSELIAPGTFGLGVFIGVFRELRTGACPAC
jgi:hypothetical protein